MLQHLPIEIVEQIVPYLDVQDIDNLLSIECFKGMLQSRVLVVECGAGKPELPVFLRPPKLPEIFPNLTKRCTSEEFTDNIPMIETYICLVILSDSFNGAEMIEHQDRHICKKYYFAGVKKCTIHPDTFNFLRKKTASMDTICCPSVDCVSFRGNLDTSQLQFPKLTHLELRDLSFIPSRLDFPLLTNLTLFRCESSDVSSRWKLPNLRTLFVRGKFRSINSSIDYETTTMKYLDLDEIEDMNEWSRISNKSLRNLDVRNLKKNFILHHMKLESLQSLVIHSDSITISNLDLPNAETMEVKLTGSENSLNFIFSINAPRLVFLELGGRTVGLLKGINVPSLKTVHFEETGDPLTETSNTFLKGVKRVRAEYTSWWKFCPHIEKLEFCGSESQCRELELFHFSELKSFTLLPSSPQGDGGWKQLICPDAPGLEAFEIRNSPVHHVIDNLGRYDNLKTISIFQDWEANTYPPDFHFKSLKFSNLVKLKIKLCSTDVVIITDCYFPKLTKVEIEREHYHVDRIPRDRDLSLVEMEAPKLRSLYISGISLVDDFVVSQYPNLRSLTIIKCSQLKTLTVEECPLLETFELYSSHKVSLNHDGCLNSLWGDSSNSSSRFGKKMKSILQKLKNPLKPKD